MREMKVLLDFKSLSNEEKNVLIVELWKKLAKLRE
jgi:hypothetical protein